MASGPSETIEAVGHEHVAAEHRSTLEVTTDDYLTPAGDCIVGIEADRAPADFGADFVEVCQSSGTTIEITLDVAGRTQRLEARGDPALTFVDDQSAVVRTSTYVDDRTIAVEADGAAESVDRTLVETLAKGAPLTMTLRARP